MFYYAIPSYCCQFLSPSLSLHSSTSLPSPAPHLHPLPALFLSLLPRCSREECIALSNRPLRRTPMVRSSQHFHWDSMGVIFPSRGESGIKVGLAAITVHCGKSQIMIQAFTVSTGPSFSQARASGTRKRMQAHRPTSKTCITEDSRILWLWKQVCWNLSASSQ